MKLQEWVQATYRHLQLSDDVMLTQAQVQRVLTAALDALCAELYRGGQLHVQQLGMLRAIRRSARTVVNNLSGTRHPIPARRTVRFQPSSQLLAFLNDDEALMTEGHELEPPNHQRAVRPDPDIEFDER